MVLGLIFIQFSCGSSSEESPSFQDFPCELNEPFTRDLSGVCRHNPPTSGALEVVN